MLALFRLLEGDRGRETALHTFTAAQHRRVMAPRLPASVGRVNHRLDAALPTYRRRYTETRCSK